MLKRSIIEKKPSTYFSALTHTYTYVHQQLTFNTALPLLRTRPDGVVIYPGFLFRLCPGCPGFDSGFILKINQNVHLFIFSTISELFNVY